MFVAKEDLPALEVGAICFLLFVMLSGDHHFLLRKLEVAKNQFSLVFGAYLAYVAVRPRGRLIYGLPVLGVFHVPEATIVGLALLLAELPLCLRRLRPSPLLVVSAVTFVGWLFVMQSARSSLADQSGIALSHIATIVLSSPRLWPTVLLLGVTAAVSLWPLVLRNREWDHVARCGLLAMQCVGATTVAFAIIEAGPELQLTPGYFELANLPNYLGPPLAFGVVLSLLVVVYRMCVEPGSASEEPEERKAAPPDWRRVGSILALVSLLGLAKIDMMPRLLFLDALHNSVVYVALGRFHKDWCRTLVQGSGYDDLYLLSDKKPTNGVENAFSALKLKLRIALQQHDPAQMRVSVVQPRENGC
jgi:hypothetical protein